MLQGDRDPRSGCGQPAEERSSPRSVWHLQRLRGRIVFPIGPEGEGEGEEGAGAPGEGATAAAEIHVGVMDAAPLWRSTPSELSPVKNLPSPLLLCQAGGRLRRRFRFSSEETQQEEEEEEQEPRRVRI